MPRPSSDDLDDDNDDDDDDDDDDQPSPSSLQGFAPIPIPSNQEARPRDEERTLRDCIESSDNIDNFKNRTVCSKALA